MEATNQLNVLISGASITGLSTAYWLSQYGFKVTLVERAPHIRAGGQVLDVRGPALEVVARMGILDEIRTNSTSLQGMSVIDALSGEETFRTTEHTVTRGRHDSPDIEVLRDDLCRILLKALGLQANFIFDDTIVALHQDETGVDVTFSQTAPQRFDLVIGADGLRSTVRRLVFHDEEYSVRYLGHYVAIFTMPNFLGLDHWEVVYQHEDVPISACVVKEKDQDARTYLGFSSEQPIEYDYRDIARQKQLVAERTIQVGTDMPKIVQYMQDSPNFYFDSMNQIIMKNWSKGRVVLVGDAGYSPSISLGQGTTVALVGAYVLAGELATHPHDFRQALTTYERELREYVDINQQQAYRTINEPPGSLTDPENVPDFAQAVVPFCLKNY